MQTKVELITPEIARIYLAQNCANRSLSKSIVTQYSKAMKRGEWMMNGESIKFDTDGNLIDGQHRLNAILTSNVSIEMLVIRGLDKTVFKTFDTGKKRSAADCMSIEGIANYTNTSSIVRMYLALRIRDGNCVLYSRADNAYRWTTDSTASEITNTQILQEYHEYADTYDEITNFAKKLYGDTRLLPISVIGAYMSFLIIYLRKDKKIVFDFFSQIVSGNNISTNSMGFVHKLLVKRSNKTIVVSYQDLDKYIKKVWNLFIRGKDVKAVYINKEEKYMFM